MNNQKCLAFADSYNTWFCRCSYNTSTIMPNAPTQFGESVFDAAPVLGNWSNAVVVTLDESAAGNHDDKVFIGEGFYTRFKLSSDMHFGDNINGYNGCVSFSWYNNSNGNKYGSDSSKAIPFFLHSYDYNPIVKQNMSSIDSKYSGCGLSPQLFEYNGTYGFTLTLFPDTEGLHGGSTRVAYYEICVKNYSDNSPASGVTQRVIGGYLPKSVDLSLDSFLYVNESFDEYHFYLNEVKICSIPMNVIDGNVEEENLIESFITPNSQNNGGCWFSMLVEGAIDSRTMFYINKIDYVPKLNY